MNWVATRGSRHAGHDAVLAGKPGYCEELQTLPACYVVSPNAYSVRMSRVAEYAVPQVHGPREPVTRPVHVTVADSVQVCRDVYVRGASRRRRPSVGARALLPSARLSILPV